jgi:hypothetical protein
MYEGSFFPEFSLALVVGCVLDYSYSNRGEVESLCGFEWPGMVSIFHVFLGLLDFFLRKMFCLVQ